MGSYILVVFFFLQQTPPAFQEFYNLDECQRTAEAIASAYRTAPNLKKPITMCMPSGSLNPT